MFPQLGRRSSSLRFTKPPLLLIGLILVLASCTSRVPPPPPPPAPTPLVVACPDEQIRGLVQRFGAAWAKRTGRTLECPVSAEAGSADVWIVRPARLGGLAESNQLLPLTKDSSEFTGFAWESLQPLYLNKLLCWGSTLYAVPLVGDAALCFYRTDLLADANHRTAFRQKHKYDLALPRTWEEFADQAAYFKENGRPEGTLPPLPAHAEDLDREYYGMAVSYARRAIRDNQKTDDTEYFSFHFDLTSGAPRIDQPGFVAALEMLRKLQPNRIQGDPQRPPASFASGAAVFCIAGPEWIPVFHESKAVKGRFAFCRLPGSNRYFDFRTGQPQAAKERDENFVPYVGVKGWLGVIPRTSKQPEAAAGLLAELGSPKVSSNIVIEPEYGSGFHRRTHDDVALHSYSLPSDLLLTLKGLLRQQVEPSPITNPVIRLRIPREEQYQQAVLDAVRAAVLEGKEPAAMLQAAAKRWDDLSGGASGRARVLAEYRLSLNLNAR